jgi:hypothetical protein
MNTSDEVLRLVRIVEGLPRRDQDKILHLVDLLSLVPASVQNESQRMLRDLLDTEPASQLECAAGVDEVIEYLEQRMPRSATRDTLGALHYAFNGRLRHS